MFRMSTLTVSIIPKTLNGVALPNAGTDHGEDHPAPASVEHLPAPGRSRVLGNALVSCRPRPRCSLRRSAREPAVRCVTFAGNAV
jgi:hypothetical protein